MLVPAGTLMTSELGCFTSAVIFERFTALWCVANQSDSRSNGMAGVCTEQSGAVCIDSSCKSWSRSS